MYDTDEAIKTIAVLECTWTNCPKEVKDEVRKLWLDNEYGNDYYYHTWSWEGIEECLNGDFSDNDYEDVFRYPVIRDYLISKGLKDKEILIHFWW